MIVKNQRIIPVVLLVLTVAFMSFGCTVDRVDYAAISYFENFKGSGMIEWEELFSKIEAGEDPFILSICREDDYLNNHIRGAYSAEWGKDLAEKVLMLPNDEPIYVYSYSGQSAGQAIVLLNMLGMEAYSMKSGIDYGASSVEGYEAYLEEAINELPNANVKYDHEILDAVTSYLNSTNEDKIVISSDEAKSLSDNNKFVLLDIRNQDDYMQNCIEGAINLPFGQGMEKEFHKFKDKSILVVCYSGQSAGQTVCILRLLGYDAKSLRFGMKSLESQNMFE